MSAIKRKNGPGKKKLNNLVKKAGGYEGLVGWFETARYDNKQATPVAKIAARNEFGDEDAGIPARPYMRPTIKKKRQYWIKFSKEFAKRILNGQATYFQATEALGLKAAGQFREAITQVFEPSLAPVTIANRLKKLKDGKTIGNLTKPLIESGVMMNSLTNVTVKK